MADRQARERAIREASNTVRTATHPWLRRAGDEGPPPDRPHQPSVAPIQVWSCGCGLLNRPERSSCAHCGKEREPGA